MGISREQALDCFRSNDLVGIGMEADAVRRRLHPDGMVSYVVQCSIDCAALTAAPAASGKTAEASLERIYSTIGETVEMGATGVRIMGLAGVIEQLGVESLESLFAGIKQRFPAICVESLSTAELIAIAGRADGLWETIERLHNAGLDSIASDDAAGLQDGAQASTFQEWLDVHRAAHELGLRTTAAMIFGAGETLEQRADFLQAIRNLQEETGGFTAFVPIAADAPGGRELDGVTAVERLKTLAISRMFLDDIDHVQATRAGQGLKLLQMGLRFGANDLGPVFSVGSNGGSEEDLRRIIRDAGFRPIERDPLYRTMFLN